PQRCCAPLGCTGYSTDGLEREPLLASRCVRGEKKKGAQARTRGSLQGAVAAVNRIPPRAAEREGRAKPPPQAHWRVHGGTRPASGQSPPD
ncbi:unnamed protein product, partial [Ectocarpus sp. 12 AP-2014]